MTVFLALGLKNSQSQPAPFQLSIRVPVQWERQKAIIEYSPGEKEITGNAVNFGVDVLAEFPGRKWLVYGGFGYFRSRFNLRRDYDHEVLNPGRDSVPIGTIARHYTYSLLRLPVGIRYTITRGDVATWHAGIEHLFNWSMKRQYTGGRYPADGNNTYTDRAYHGNTVNLLLFYTLHLSQTNAITIAPYTRMFNRYKKDFILFEPEPDMHTRYFDAVGLHLQYSFSL